MYRLNHVLLSGLIMTAMPLASFAAAPISMQKSTTVSLEGFIAFENGLIAKSALGAETSEPDEVESIMPPVSESAMPGDVDVLGSRIAALGRSNETPFGLNLAASLVPVPGDIGQSVNIYVAAVLPGGMTFFRNEAGGFAPVLSLADPLPIVSRVTAGNLIDVPIVSNLPMGVPVGTQILVGYGRSPEDLLSGKYDLVYMF